MQTLMQLMMWTLVQEQERRVLMKTRVRKGALLTSAVLVSPKTLLQAKRYLMQQMGVRMVLGLTTTVWTVTVRRWAQKILELEMGLLYRYWRLGRCR